MVPGARQELSLDAPGILHGLGCGLVEGAEYHNPHPSAALVMMSEQVGHANDRALSNLAQFIAPELGDRYPPPRGSCCCCPALCAAHWSLHVPPAECVAGRRQATCSRRTSRGHGFQSA